MDPAIIKSDIIERDSSEQIAIRKVEELELERDRLQSLVEIQKQILSEVKSRQGFTDSKVALIQEYSAITGVAAACDALSISRAHYYRLIDRTYIEGRKRVKPKGKSGRPPSISLEAEERVIRELTSERFAGCAPRVVWAKLREEGVDLCSWRTMYRIMKRHHEAKELNYNTENLVP